MKSNDTEKTDNLMNSYYNDCLQEFHKYVNGQIVNIPALTDLASMVVKGLMTDKQVLDDLADDYQQYQSVILCRSCQCGATLAYAYSFDPNNITRIESIKHVIDNPEKYSDEVIHQVLKMSSEDFFLGFCGALQNTWEFIEWDGLKGEERLLMGGEAAYQLGISMVLLSCGY